MKMPKITFLPLTIAALIAPFHVNASTGSCAAGWTSNPVPFESAIEYDDMQSKANPTVHVLINGKTAKMLLDTGSNKNALWDASLLDEIPSPHPVKFSAHHASVEGRRVEAKLGDGRGNTERQEFYLFTNSSLAAYGYSGILSPQAVARDKAVVVDFERNCFFTSPPFDIHSDMSLHVHRGITIPNPDGEMVISVDLDGKTIPLIVDSGSFDTIIIDSLVASKPKGRESSRSMNAFGSEIQQDAQMRLVDLKINGKNFKSHPVAALPKISDKGIGVRGYIGMDILKDHVIYHDGAQHEFILMNRQQAGKPPVSELQIRTD